MQSEMAIAIPPGPLLFILPYLFTFFLCILYSAIRLYVQWGVDVIRPPFPCVSYEATKRVSRWQRVYGVKLCRGRDRGMPAQNAPFLRSQHSPLKFLHTPPPPTSLSPVSFLPLPARELRAIIIIILP